MTKLHKYFTVSIAGNDSSWEYITRYICPLILVWSRNFNTYNITKRLTLLNQVLFNLLNFLIVEQIFNR